YFNGRIRRGPDSLALVQERVRRAGLGAAAERAGAELLDASRGSEDRGGVGSAQQQERGENNKESEEVAAYHSSPFTAGYYKVSGIGRSTARFPSILPGQP